MKPNVQNMVKFVAFRPLWRQFWHFGHKSIGSIDWRWKSIDDTVSLSSAIPALTSLQVWYTELPCSGQTLLLSGWKKKRQLALAANRHVLVACVPGRASSAAASTTIVAANKTQVRRRQVCRSNTPRLAKRSRQL